MIIGAKKEAFRYIKAEFSIDRSGKILSKSW